jgi:hypothetical protein
VTARQEYFAAQRVAELDAENAAALLAARWRVRQGGEGSFAHRHAVHLAWLDAVASAAREVRS